MDNGLHYFVEQPRPWLHPLTIMNIPTVSNDGLTENIARYLLNSYPKHNTHSSLHIKTLYCYKPYQVTLQWKYTIIGYASNGVNTLKYRLENQVNIQENIHLYRKKWWYFRTPIKFLKWGFLGSSCHFQGSWVPCSSPVFQTLSVFPNNNNNNQAVVFRTSTSSAMTTWYFPDFLIFPIFVPSTAYVTQWCEKRHKHGLISINDVVQSELLVFW